MLNICTQDIKKNDFWICLLPHHIAHKGPMNNFSSDYFGKTIMKNCGAVYQQYNMHHNKYNINSV